MKLKICSLCCGFLFYSFLGYGQVLNYDWITQIGGVKTDMGKSITVDNNGNIYCLGNFQGTCDFNPDTGTDLHSASGSVSNFNLWLVKVDLYGNYIWGKQLEGNFNYSYNLSIDHDNSGNIYISGEYRDSINFDGTNKKISQGGTDVFFAKYSSEGVFAWAKTIGGSTNDVLGKMIVDNGGNILAVGDCSGVVDFDPGIGTFYLGGIVGIGGYGGSYILRLDNNGNFVLAKILEANSGGVGTEVRTCCYDNLGNLIVGGIFRNSEDFDPDKTFSYPSTATANGSVDGYILKLNASGSFVWVKHLRSSSGNEESLALHLQSDLQGNIYCAGNYRGTVDMNLGNGTTNITSYNSNSADGFLLKIDTSKNLTWVKSFGGLSGGVNPGGLSLDAQNNVYMSGVFVGTIDFDPSLSSSKSFTDANSGDIFINKLDSNGNFILANRFILHSYGNNYDLYANNNNIFLTGRFSDSCDFSTANSTQVRYSIGQADAFIYKLSQGPVNTKDISSPKQVIISPNPSKGIFTISADDLEKYHFEFCDVQGRIITYSSISKKGNKLTVNLSSYPAGLYFVRYRIEDQFGIQKFFIK